jgi:hypothetical protein
VPLLGDPRRNHQYAHPVDLDPILSQARVRQRQQYRVGLLPP